MYKSVIINNFRGIRCAKVEGLGDLNVFFGKNNCGKTSLLEALFLISGQSNPLLPVTTNAVRGLGRFLESDLAWVFYNMNLQQPVHIETEGDLPRHMDITAFRKYSETIDLSAGADAAQESAPAFYGYHVDFDGGLNSELVVENGNQQNSKINVNPSYSEAITAVYTSPRLQVFDQYAEKLKGLVTEKKTEPIIQALRSLEPNLQSLTIVGNDVMVDVGMDKLLPIQMLGDGVIRILSVVMNIFQCKDGVVMIDEIDNGLHFSVMPQLWKVVFAMAKQHHVQLFVTTHNIDSLRALSDACQEEYASMLKAFKLIKTNDAVLNALPYCAQTLQYMLNQETEVR